LTHILIANTWISDACVKYLWKNQSTFLLKATQKNIFLSSLSNYQNFAYIRPYSFDTFLRIIYCNKKIKRYWDKKLSLSYGFQWLTKVRSLRNIKYLDLWFIKSLPWPIEINTSKIYFYLNSFLLQYIFIAILCVKMSRVNKALFWWLYILYTVMVCTFDALFYFQTSQLSKYFYQNFAD